MELNKNKYIAISEGVLMYLTKDKYNLLSEVKTEEECYFRFFTVNKTGRDIVMMINGKETVGELEKKFCEEQMKLFDRYHTQYGGTVPTEEILDAMFKEFRSVME